MTDVALAILAKAPVPGLAKTRLAPLLGETGAAELQARLVARTVATACAAAVGPLQLAPVTLWCAPDTAYPDFVAMAREYPLELATQAEHDLGARMLAACRHNPGKATLVIGTDCPVLTVEHVQQAARCLHYGSDAVMIPAEDGGYVLIGMREPDARVFADIQWGTGQVLAETRRRMKSIGWHWNELQALWDIDRPEDLIRLRRERADLGL